MKKHFHKSCIHIITCILLCQTLFGQQVYQLRHYGKPGDIYLYNRLTGLQNEVSPSGPNVTWDLRSNLNLNTRVSKVVTKEEGISFFTYGAICPLSDHSSIECQNIWNSTDQALLIPDSLFLIQYTLSNLQRYQNKTSNQLLENFFGFNVTFSGTPLQAVIVYQTPDTILNFPLTYGNQWTSNVQWSLNLEPAGQNIMYSSNQSRTTSIDSWGTLITPYDTFENVIRLRSAIVHEDTLTTDTSVVPISLTQIEYMWFDTNFTLPVMTAGGILNGSNDVISVVQYIYDSTCETPTWAADTDQDIYYLDATGSVTVNFIIANANADEYSWDFGDGTTGTSTGNISHLYTNPGTYAVAVSGCMTNCLPLNSCGFDIIDFVVLDTLSSSVLTLPGDQLGIKIYPSPVSESFNIELPKELGTQHFEILDLSGRRLMNGILGTGITSIRLNNLENGLYGIRMWAKEGTIERMAIMRFVVIK